MKIHWITHEADELNPDRVHWECDCGAGGSGPEWGWEEHSDKHIGPDEGRRDVYPAR